MAFLSCRSAAALCSNGVSTKLAVRLLTVRSAMGSTPGAFSRSVTRWPRELKFAINGYLPSDWPFDQQSQLSCRVEPLPRMGWAESGVWRKRLRTTTGVNWVWTRLKMPPPSAPGVFGKYLASRGPRSFVLRKRLSASLLDQESLRMRSVDWLPRMASPTSGASRSRFRTIRGVNCSCTKFHICPDSAPGARTR